MTPQPAEQPLAVLQIAFLPGDGHRISCAMQVVDGADVPPDWIEFALDYARVELVHKQRLLRLAGESKPNILIPRIVPRMPNGRG